MLWKRLGLPLLAVAVAVLLAVAVDRAPFGVASAAPTQTVTPSVPVQIPIAIRNINPGDRGTAGTFRIRYDGAVPAWVGLDADLVGVLAGGEEPLAITIAGGSGRYSARGANQVVGLLAPGDTLDMSVSYTLPRTAGNTYQAQNATLFLQLHAVEAANNTVFELGRAVGPASWSRRVGQVAVAWNQLDSQSPNTSAPETAAAADRPQSPAPQLAAADFPGVTPAAVAPSACCLCMRNLLWLWLLYALLLVLAMLAAFYLGWRLALRRQRPRFRPKRLPRATTDPHP